MFEIFKKIFCQAAAKKDEGFTLIELIVVIAIIGIISIVGLNNFIKYSETQQLNVATGDVENALQTAKSLASSNVVTNGTITCPANQSFGGYEFIITSQTNYKTAMACYDTKGIPQPYPVGQLHTLAGGNLKFNAANYPVAYFFHSQNGVVDACDSTHSTPGALTITQSKNSQSSTIAVSKLGIISVNNASSQNAPCTLSL